MANFALIKATFLKIFFIGMRLFTKAERSSFPYWFAHWCAFNMTAIMCKHWRVGYLFHDWYKPWLRIFLPYSKVQKFHRLHSRHHLEWIENRLERIRDKKNYNKLYNCLRKFDWYGMLIDWECSRHTKLESPLTAYEEMEKIFGDPEHMLGKFPMIYQYMWIIKTHYMKTALKELGLWPEKQV